MSTPTQAVDDYLAALPEDSRATLQKIRESIRAAAPDAVESISYKMPAYKYRGRPLAYFGAYKNHCSFFPASGAIVEANAAALAGYDTDKGTIRFPVSKPLPAALVKKIVKARMVEIDSKAK